MADFLNYLAYRYRQTKEGIKTIRAYVDIRMQQSAYIHFNLTVNNMQKIFNLINI